MTAHVWGLWALCGFAVWLLVYGFLLSGIQERRAQAVLYTHFRQSLAESTAPCTPGCVGWTKATIPTGTPIAVMSAPVIGMRDVVIVEGTSSSTLRDGPGHRRDSVLPGQVGVSILYGRSSTFGAPFGDVDRLEPGDLVSITTQEGQFNYKVDEVRRAGDPVPTVSAGTSRIVLETSTGRSWRSPSPGRTRRGGRRAGEWSHPGQPEVPPSGVRRTPAPAA